MPRKLETILVGVDLTTPSMDGAEWIVKTFPEELHMVLAHVVETGALRRFFPGGDAEGKAGELRERVADRLEELRARLGADRCEVVFTEGSPGVRLAELAEEIGADLIAVGAHRETIAGGLLGGVVSRLLGTSRVPVLIAHGLMKGPPSRALVAVDRSETYRDALSWTRTFSELFDLRGEVLFAVEPPGVAVGTALFATDEQYREARDAVVERARAWVARAVGQSGLDAGRFEPLAAYGRPELEIGVAAERLGADLLVVGTRGHTHGRALVLGSVSRRVIEASECPVLVVPPHSR